MRKNIWKGIILLIVFCLIFFSKWRTYKNNVEFYKKDINFSVIKITETRGTKVYYDKDNFFYFDTYKGDKFELGDSILKKNGKIKLYNKSSLKGYGEIIKPKENYFEYFFGW